jgi:hypothetical protein
VRLSRSFPLLRKQTQRGPRTLVMLAQSGTSFWREPVLGFQITRWRLQELSQISASQYFAIDLITGEVLAFILKRAMLMDSTHFQKLKDEARAVLIRYCKDGWRIFGENHWLACSPQWANSNRATSGRTSLSICSIRRSYSAIGPDENMRMGMRK